MKTFRGTETDDAARRVEILTGFRFEGRSYLAGEFATFGGRYVRQLIANNRARLAPLPEVPAAVGAPEVETSTTEAAPDVEAAVTPTAPSTPRRRGGRRARGARGHEG